MRIAVNRANLNQVQSLLHASTGCRIHEEPDGSFSFVRMMVNHRRGTILTTRVDGFRRRIQAVKAAVRQFGREAVAVKRLAERITVIDRSCSQTQHAVEIRIDGQFVEILDNTEHRNRPDFSKSNPWMRHTLEEARLVGASYVMRVCRELLGEGQWPDPVTETLEAMKREQQAA